MRVTTTYQSNPRTGAGKIVARGNGKQYTMPYDHSIPAAGNHGLAARTLVTKVVPSWRRADTLNSVKCIEVLAHRTVFEYRD